MLLGVAQTPDFSTLVQHLAAQLAAATTTLLVAIDGVIVQVSRLAYVTVLMVGATLWATRPQRMLGKEMVTVGLIFAVLAEYFFPFIARLA